MNFLTSHGIACNMSNFSVFAVASFTVNEIVPGFRSLFKCTIPDSGKVKLVFAFLHTISITTHCLIKEDMKIKCLVFPAS